MRALLRVPWLVALLVGVLLVMAVVPVAQAAPEPAPVAVSCGYWYTVRPGDSWSRVSAWTGVSVAALQAANPSKVRPPRYWLYIGDTLWIPCGGPPPGPPPTSCAYIYTVQRGDSWFRISGMTGVPVRALQAANPRLVRPNDVLWVGDRMCIPGW